MNENTNIAGAVEAARLALVISDFAERWAERDLIEDIAPKLTCGELDALVLVFEEAGLPSAAEHWTEAHAAHDEGGDSHFVTIYSKPNCVQCDMTKKAMTKHGIEYREVDVTEDDDALAYVKGLGYMTAPVVVTSDGDHWGGFNPDKIAELSAE